MFLLNLSHFRVNLQVPNLDSHFEDKRPRWLQMQLILSAIQGLSIARRRLMARRTVGTIIIARATLSSLTDTLHADYLLGQPKGDPRATLILVRSMAILCSADMTKSDRFMGFQTFPWAGEIRFLCLYKWAIVLLYQT